MKKVGRPTTEDEPRNVKVNLWITATMSKDIEAARGRMKQSDWLRMQIKRGLP